LRAPRLWKGLEPRICERSGSAAAIDFVTLHVPLLPETRG
jgi:hypothetical protein